MLVELQYSAYTNTILEHYIIVLICFKENADKILRYSIQRMAISREPMPLFLLIEYGRELVRQANISDNNWYCKFCIVMFKVEI